MLSLSILSLALSYSAMLAGAIAGGVVASIVLILVAGLLVATLLGFLVHRRKTVPSMCFHAYVVDKNLSMCPYSSCCAGAEASASKAPSTR